jgi:hypothetical protein
VRFISQLIIELLWAKKIKGTSLQKRKSNLRDWWSNSPQVIPKKCERISKRGKARTVSLWWLRWGSFSTPLTLMTKIIWLSKTLKLKRALILRNVTSWSSSKLCHAGPSSTVSPSESMRSLLPTTMAKSLWHLLKKVNKRNQISYLISILSFKICRYLIDFLLYNQVLLVFSKMRETKFYKVSFWF